MNNIKIMSRIKPIINTNEESCIHENNNEIQLIKCQKRYLKTSKFRYKYNFDKVFDEKCDNLDIYNYFSIDILKHMMKNQRNVMFYVYGHTGSGKTHTILGNSKEEGFLGLILRDMIDIGKSVKVSVMEIHNNKCYDLLNNKKVIVQRENYENNYVLSTCKQETIINNEQINRFKVNLKNRRTGVSSENDQSSRSHLIINIEFAKKSLKILDLAGCEKARRSLCKDRNEFKENGEINQSLFVLKECIRALIDGKKHIPYRRCELTKVLKDSFDPKNKTYVMSTVTQEIRNSQINLDVLNYICNIKKIKISDIQSNLPYINFNMQSSPRIKYLKFKKSLLNTFVEQENVILNEMFEKNTTANLFEKYVEIIDKKKKLLEAYKPTQNLIPKPPPRMTAKERSAKLKNINYIISNIKID
tara:strand:- start:934 stop:2181 length:1248 start_codon:yes stop_codon:yes gene_type:complete